MTIENFDDVEGDNNPDSSDGSYRYLWGRRSAVKHAAQTNRLYQLERQQIMEWRENIIKVCSVFGGTLAFTETASDQVRVWAGAAVVFANLMSLVFGYGAKARDASKRTAEWTLLARDIEAAGERDFTEEQIKEWAARCHTIEVGEPIANKWLLVRCSEMSASSMKAKIDAPPRPWYEKWRIFYFIA